MKKIKWVTGVTTSKWTSWDTNPRANFLSSSPLLPLRAEALLRTLKEKWESSQWGRLMCSLAWNRNRWLCQVSGMKVWHWHIRSVYLPPCPFHIHSNPVGEKFLLAIFCICGNSKWLNSDSNPRLFAWRQTLFSHYVTIPLRFSVPWYRGLAANSDTWSFVSPAGRGRLYFLDVFSYTVRETVLALRA